MRAAQALALLRGRRHVIAEDIRDLAPDVLRHRLVLSYDALADRVRAGRAARAACSTPSTRPARVPLAEAA